MCQFAMKKVYCSFCLCVGSYSIAKFGIQLPLIHVLWCVADFCLRVIMLCSVLQWLCADDPSAVELYLVIV